MTLMPIYIHRTIQDYPSEYNKCPANPDGYEFSCFFCGNFYKTKGSSITHMKRCCEYYNDIEYDNDVEIDEGITVFDLHRNNDAVIKTIKYFIRNNELESLSELSSVQIKEHIQIKLSSNGYSSKLFYLNNTVFSIYEFFFEVTSEEKREHEEYIHEYLMNNLWGNII